MLIYLYLEILQNKDFELRGSSYTINGKDSYRTEKNFSGYTSPVINEMGIVKALLFWDTNRWYIGLWYLDNTTYLLGTSPGDPASSFIILARGPVKTTSESDIFFQQQPQRITIGLLKHQNYLQ